MAANSTSITFDTITAWIGHDYSIDIQDCALTSTMVDNALIAFAGGSFTGNLINVGGTNAARTSASDAALATLLAAGNSVNLN